MKNCSFCYFFASPRAQRLKMVDLPFPITVPPSAEEMVLRVHVSYVLKLKSGNLTIELNYDKIN